jgi:predicted ATPase/DNA-binding SARP family transcriptional activator
MIQTVLLAAPQGATERPLHITLLGPPQITMRGTPLSLPRRQLRALCYRLAVALQPVPREQLCFLLWPDIADAAARRNLTVLLNQLRQALPSPDVILTHGDAILLDTSQVQSDTVAFAEAIGFAAQRAELELLAAAVNLYTGSFLHGFSLPNSPEFDMWMAQERQHWGRRYLDTLAMLVDGYASSGAYTQAIAAAQRALAVDELAEDMHRWLIQLYAASGDRAAALRQFERCVLVLERELGVSPLPETRAVYNAVRAGEVPLRAGVKTDTLRAGRSSALAAPPASTSTQSTPAAPRTSLPTPPTPLIARRDERAAAAALLADPGVRLLTLVGAGGSGKTRLALQIAWDVAEQFADGALFVALASLRAPALVVPAIGLACGLAQPSPAALTQYLRDKQLLLVLDNCEHLLDAAPRIGGLLDSAPGLRVLATSRAALNVHGEQTFRVPPLPLPELSSLPPLAELADIPAVALLLARTRALNPRFQLTADNAADLAAICVRLDGLPLAIELAAARLKLLAPRDLLRRLDHRLPLLTTGTRDLPERQQTLRATIDWSYRLLDTREQLWFERCGVFVGGWTLADAQGLDERLRWPTTPPISEGDARSNLLDMFGALVDKSLVQMQTARDGEPRFVMLETIREHALTCLRERGGDRDVAQAHAGYFLTFAEQASQQYYGPQVAEWAARTDLAHDNLREALRWFLEQDTDAEQALRFGGAMYRFWHLRGYYSEGLQWLERVLAKSTAFANPTRAEMFSQAGFLASALGQIDQAIALFEDCLALCQLVDAPGTKTAALNGLGIIFDRQGDPRGLALLEEAAAQARELNNPARLCAMLRAYANALVTNGTQIERGIAVYAEALIVAREHKLNRSVALILAGLGSALTFTGEYTRAQPLLLEGLALQQELDDVPLMAWSYLFLGVLSYLQGESARARQYFSQNLAIVAKLGNLNSLPDTLEGTAGVATAQQPVLAARLLGAAEALRESLKLVRSPVAQAYYDRILASVRTQLPADELRDAWQAGRGLSAKQVIAEAEAFAAGEGEDNGAQETRAQPTVGGPV